VSIILLMTGEKEARAARLREARIAAGFADATKAAERFGWHVVTYRSHENAIRGLKSSIVARYAKAYKVSFTWLATGEGPMRGPGIDAALMVLPPEVSKPLIEAILKLIEAAGPPKGKIPKP
jgi:hypothetical protein